MMIYDLGLLGDDKELANAVWRRFFLASEPDFQSIEILVKYIRENMAYLETKSLNDIVMYQNIEWISLKAVK